MNHRMNRSEWLALLLLSVLWGGSFFFAAVLIKTLPFTIIFLRVGLPAVILNAFVKQSCGKPDSGLLHGARHRACIRATRWLATTI
jgi:drug/metabolite transporter (DMT)-like permease